MTKFNHSYKTLLNERGILENLIRVHSPLALDLVIQEDNDVVQKIVDEYQEHLDDINSAMTVLSNYEK